MKRTYTTEDKEPEDSKQPLPSEKEHLFQITDIYTQDDEIGQKLKLDNNTVSARAEVVGGEEEGRSLLIRLNLDQDWKGFYYTRLFLKAIGEPYKGQFDTETDHWIGRQFYAQVKHNDGYANIDAYNFSKVVEQYKPPVGQPKSPEDIVKSPEDMVWDS